MSSKHQTLEATLLRMRRFDPTLTDAHRIIHGAAHGWPGWGVDRFGEWLLSQSDAPVSADQSDFLDSLLHAVPELRGVYHKELDRHVRHSNLKQSCPQLTTGEAAPDSFEVRENGVRFEISFREGYSVGLFLDQRENRNRILINRAVKDFPVFPGGADGAEVLNTFAYTAGFSLCAARVGARSTSLDLSRKYLDWGRRNFELNQVDPTAHDFIYGDAFDWMKRLAKKGRRFDLVVLDPPTFSKSKQSGVFRAEKDFPALLAAALVLLKPEGVVFASCNTVRMSDERFEKVVLESVRAGSRRVLQSNTPRQGADFPVTPRMPAHLKQIWLRVE